MSFSDQGQLPHQIDVAGPERGAKIVYGETGETADQGIGNPRGPASEHTLCAPLTPTAHEVVAFLELREEGTDLVGKVL